jgi:hypothetical protein
LSPTPLKNDGVHQLGLLFPTYGKIQNVPNHQPVMVLINKCGISTNHPFLDHPSIFILKNG